MFPPSKSTVPYPKWFAYFPCNTRLKKDKGGNREGGVGCVGWGDAAIITGFTCSQLLSPFTQLFWIHQRILS